MANNWFSAGQLTNPAINAIIADTGALPAGMGNAAFTVVISASVVAGVVLELRDAANAATLNSQMLLVPINGTFTTPYQIQVPVADGERIRLRMNAAIVGVVQGSIFVN